MRIEEVTDEVRGEVKKLIESNWKSTIMVSRGKVHKADQLPGFVAYYKDKIQGLITYEINNDQCEIISLNSLIENKGIGSKLLAKVIRTARSKNCQRVWLVTTNDNIKALKFYQKKNFNLVAVHVNAVAEARKIKPEIPKYGVEGIPIKHEVELEKII